MHWFAQIGTDNEPIRQGSGKLLPRVCIEAFLYQINELIFVIFFSFIQFFNS